MTVEMDVRYIEPDPDIRILNFRTFASSDKSRAGLEICWTRGGVSESARVIRLAGTEEEGGKRLMENPPEIFRILEESGKPGDEETDFPAFLIRMAAFRASGTNTVLWETDIVPFPGMSVADSLYCVLSAFCRNIKIDGKEPEAEAGRIMMPEVADQILRERAIGIDDIDIGAYGVTFSWYSILGFGQYTIYRDPPENDDPKSCNNSEPCSEPCKGGILLNSDSECMDNPRNPVFLRCLFRSFCRNFLKEAEFPAPDGVSG